MSKATGVVNLRLQSTLFSSNFLQYLLHNIKLFASAFLGKSSEVSVAGDAEMAQLKCQIWKMVLWVGVCTQSCFIKEAEFSTSLRPCQHRLDKLEAKAEQEAVMEVVRYKRALNTLSCCTWSASWCSIRRATCLTRTATKSNGFRGPLTDTGTC